MKRNEIFRFKQFEVSHSINAQKVSTDSVLLGAWADLNSAKKILDIGTGSGVLALMAAQRNLEATIVGIEIENDFAEEAKSNFAKNIFSSRMELKIGDVRQWNSEKFDHIISNPPYFSNSLKSQDKFRNHARHDLNLSFEELASSVNRLLIADGLFSLVIPFNFKEHVCQTFNLNGLKLSNVCYVKHTYKSSASLVLLEFRKSNYSFVKKSELIIREEDGYSLAYQQLLREFLIIF